MSKLSSKDQDAIAKLYFEGFSSDSYRNTGHDDDRYSDEDLDYTTMPVQQPSNDPHITTTNGFADWLLGEKLPFNLQNSETGEVLLPANRRITLNMLKSVASVYIDSPDKLSVDDPKWENFLNKLINEKVPQSIQKSGNKQQRYGYSVGDV